MRVGTGAANAPVLALYEGLGFVRVGERSVGDGIAYADLELGSGAARRA